MDEEGLRYTLLAPKLVPEPSEVHARVIFDFAKESAKDETIIFLS